MKSLNTLSGDTLFQKTELYQTFQECPLGFIDAGAAGGVHPLIMPVASLVHCTCFEPDQTAYEKLSRYFQENELFAKFTLFDKAIGREKADSSLYLTKSAVNSSLMKPRKMLIDRYGVKGFAVERVSSVQTQSLDSFVYENTVEGMRTGEFIKLDCQGAEYDILEGGLRTLSEQCVTLWCEVELLKMYENQKSFSELDIFLNQKGFRLYGLYPNYISTKQMDRKVFDTEERIIWADALYFKDPLAEVNREKKFTKRQLDVLLLTAMLTEYYDFALELVRSFYGDAPDGEMLTEVVMALASKRKKMFADDLMKLINDCQRYPEQRYLLARKFVDSHRSNSNLDYINIEDYN